MQCAHTCCCCCCCRHVNFDVPDSQRANIKAKLDAMFKAMISVPLNLPGTK